MSMLLQVASPPAPPVPPPALPDPVSVQVQALTGQEIESVTNLVRLAGERVNLTRQLNGATGVNREQLTARLAEVEGQIAGERAKIADIKQRIGELRRESPNPTPGPAFTLLGPPAPRMFGLSKDEFMGGLTFVLLFPLVLVATRNMWRRGSRPQRLQDESDRFARLQQAVEAVAIEVERIGEAQRFQTKLMTERQSSPVLRE
jgi:hypothetical protein